MRLAAIAILCLLAACSYNPPKPFDQTTAGAPASVDPKALNYARLKESFGDVRSVDELLTRLEKDPRNAPFLARPVVVYASQSQHEQEVTRNNPRLILHSPTARLVLALTNGVPEVEMFEFDEKRARWLPHLLSFDRNLQAHFDDRPKSCANCHGEKPRPLWSNFRVWPGSYGSFEDTLGRSPQELADYRAFLQDGRASDTIYRHFQFAKVLPKDSVLEGRPNQRLNAYLTFLNFQRIRREILRNPMFRSLEIPILQAAYNCELTVGTEPDIDGTSEINARSLASRTARVAAAKSETPSARGAEAIAKLRVLLEPIGVDMKSWALSHAPKENSYDFGGVAGEIDDFTEGLLRAVQAREPQKFALVPPPLAKGTLQAREQTRIRACAVLEGLARA